MKTWMLACLLLAGLSVAAQHMPRKGHGRQHMQELPADELAVLQSKQMTLALDLSAAQEQQLRQLLPGRIEARRAMREAYRKDTTGMADPHQRYQRMIERLDSEIAFRRELKKILGEAPYEQWKQAQTPRKMGHRQGRKYHRD